MKKEKVAHLLISKLDDIMWLYNIRANDVDCNPVALTFTFISEDEAVLFIQKEALTDEVKQYLTSMVLSAGIIRKLYLLSKK